MTLRIESVRRKAFRSIEALVLASESPRRRELLESMGLTFDVHPSGVDETNVSGGEPENFARTLARNKALEIAEIRPDNWVIGADTIVVLNDDVLGKPADANDASAMLRKLSGRVHQVITALCIARANPSYSEVRSVSTRVQFKTLSDDEIRAYVNTGEPMDKAGGYGIQGAGAFLVRAIEGSYTNVVGLPLCETLEWLMELRLIAPEKGR
jgi:septum formation protein